MGLYLEQMRLPDWLTGRTRVEAAVAQARQAWDATQRAIDAAWDADHRTCSCGAIVTIWRTDAQGVVRCVRCASEA